MTELLNRSAEKPLEEALRDTRVVLISGARQAGKSTLAQLVANRHKRTLFRQLDNPPTLRAAIADPVSFVQHKGLMVIDEVQRAPELILPIKAIVDRSNLPGQFLLTGSAQVFALRQVPDTLVGRVDTIELWPFSQSEINHTTIDIWGLLLEPDKLNAKTSTYTKSDYLKLIVRGGFPEALKRRDRSRRQRFFERYVDDLLERDVTELQDVERVSQLRTLVELLAARNGQILVYDRLSQDSGIPTRTLKRYVQLLELTFLIKRLPAWSNSATRRATASPKLCFVDSGLAAYLSGLSDLAEDNEGIGHLVEAFVAMELARLVSYSEKTARIMHYRTRDGAEVDTVLVLPGGSIIGIETKFTATISENDFQHIEHLRRKIRTRLQAGIVFYAGSDTLSFGNNLWAIPISHLWTP